MPSLAIADALDLARAPAIAVQLRKQPIGREIRTLILIAAGSKEECLATARRTKMHPTMIHDAAVLYIQQVLFHSSSDAYRVLGCASGAEHAELRDNMRLLLKWLHPDHNQDPLENVFIDRVLGAWREVSSADKRHEYNRRQEPPTRPAARPNPQRRPTERTIGRMVWIERPYRKRSRARQIGRFAVKTTCLVIAAGAALALVFPDLAASLLSWFGVHDVFGFAVAGEVYPLEGLAP